MEESHKKTQLRIGKMTCINCQNKIEKKLNHTKGIISAKVSYTNGTADILYNENEISLKEITAVIERLDYEVLSPQKQYSSNIIRTVCMLTIIAALYAALQSLGLLNLLAPSQLADTKMGYGMLFVIGLITSVHCVAMCGGINISQCIPQSGQQEAKNNGKLDTFRPALAYNLGRVLSYTAAGFVLGLAGFLIGGGTEIGFSTLLQGILKIIAGLFMVIMGINMLNLFPQLRKFTIRMPGFLARRIGEKRAKSSRPFLVGLLNGFMPCGPLQSMWLVALASGNPLSGALSMLLFSLGTVPLMLGLGSIVSVLGKKFTDKVMTIGAVLVTVLGLAMLSQGGSLSGWLSPSLLLVLIISLSIAGVLLSLPAPDKTWKIVLEIVSAFIVIGSCALWNVRSANIPNQQETETAADVIDGEQVINSTLTPGRYPNITVQAGIPVKWVIDAPEGSINGCNYKMLIRNYDIEYTFHTGENIVTFTPTDTGTVSYSCWMGMIRGSIFVTDGSESNPTASDEEVRVPTPAGYTIPTEKLAVASITEDANGNPFQEVSIGLTDDGFSPAVIVVQKNMTAIWNIDSELTDTAGADSLLAPYYSTALPLQAGMNQLTLSPTESFELSTGDNRFYCYVKVVDDLSDIDEAAIKEEVSSFETLIYPAEVFESAGMSCCQY